LARAVASKARIVVAGGGAAGLTVANKLAGRLQGAQIIMIEPNDRHVYWPGLTLVGAGVYTPEHVSLRTADYVGSKVTWVRQRVAEIDPDIKVVRTEDNQRFEYDFLVVALGLEYHYEGIPGLSADLIGREGIGSVYAGPEAAMATRGVIANFLKDGGDGVFVRPSGPIRCAGAPLKVTFLTDANARAAGVRDKLRFDYYTPEDKTFSVPVVNDIVLRRFEEKGIEPHLMTRITGIDPGRREVSFADDLGTTTRKYDFIHLPPPMRAVRPVRESKLAIREGALAKGGWLEVDRLTLRHTRYPEVFGCGDINATPIGKTAATVKKSSGVVVDNLVSVIEGQEPARQFDGYTSCPLITAIGKAALVEFNYQLELTPTFPVVDQLHDDWRWWFLKVYLLKPVYQQMLHGRVPA